jgi:hypothetical protein
VAGERIPGEREVEQPETRASGQAWVRSDKPESSRSLESLAHVRSMRPAPRRSAVPWIATVAAILLIGGGWLYERVAHGVRADSSLGPASILRTQAFDACRASRWQQCLASFDEAKAIDFAGDDDTRVQAERARAVRALLDRPK